MKILNFVLMLSLVASMSCGKKDKNDDKGGKGDIEGPRGEDDFKGYPKSKYSKEDVQTALLDIDELKADNEQSESEEESSFEICKGVEAPKAEAKGEVMTFQGDIDMVKDCKEEEHPTREGTSSGSVKYKFALKCVGADFTSLDGKSLDDIGDEELASANCIKDESTMGGIVELQVKMRFEKDDSVLSMHTEASENNAGDYCMLIPNGDTTAIGTCIYNSYDASFWGLKKDEELPYEDGGTRHELLYMKGKSLEHTKGNPYFSKGLFSIRLNDWVGNVTYTDGQTAPSYELKKGNESVSGTLARRVRIHKTNIMQRWVNPLRQDLQVAKRFHYR